MIDRDPDHGWLWSVIVSVTVVMFFLIYGIASSSNRLEQRITALEDHSRALTKACARDEEVKDLSKRVQVLEEQR